MQLFTIQEAQALLPTVEGLLRDLVEGRQELAEKQAELEEAEAHTSSNGHSVEEKLFGRRKEIEELVASLNARLSQLHDLGCAVKDLQTGLVDFPSMRDGAVVNLCWRLGEPTIAFWHSLDTGFAHRQPL